MQELFKNLKMGVAFSRYQYPAEREVKREECVIDHSVTFWHSGSKMHSPCSEAGHGSVLPFRSLGSVHDVLAAAAFGVVVTRRVLWRLAPGESH